MGGGYVGVFNADLATSLEMRGERRRRRPVLLCGSLLLEVEDMNFIRQTTNPTHLGGKAGSVRQEMNWCMWGHV